MITLRRRAASPVLTAAPDRPGIVRRITVYFGRAVKFGGDRADLDAHLAVNNAGAGITGYGRTRETRGDRRHIREKAPHLLDRMMDDKALVERRLRRKIGRNILVPTASLLPRLPHERNRTTARPARQHRDHDRNPRARARTGRLPESP